MYKRLQLAENLLLTTVVAEKKMRIPLVLKIDDC